MATALEMLKHHLKTMDDLLATQKELDDLRDYFTSLTGLDNLISGTQGQIVVFNGIASLSGYDNFTYGSTGNYSEFSIKDISLVNIGDDNVRSTGTNLYGSAIIGERNSVTAMWQSMIIGYGNYVADVDQCLIVGMDIGWWGDEPLNGPNYSIIAGRGHRARYNDYLFMTGEESLAINNWQTNILAGDTTVTASNATTVMGYSNIIYSSDYSLFVGQGIKTNENDHSFIVGKNHGAKNVDRFAIIGGQSITATESDTVYVPKLNVVTNGEGVILHSPDGTAYKLTVLNGGSLTATPV